MIFIRGGVVMTSNPELRKLSKRIFYIAKASVKGEKIMCPCGCLAEFRKRTDSQVFAQKVGCKDTYYNVVRSKSNHAFGKVALNRRAVFRRYIVKKGFKV